jgi:hypothetical protein
MQGANAGGGVIHIQRAATAAGYGSSDTGNVCAFTICRLVGCHVRVLRASVDKLRSVVNFCVRYILDQSSKRWLAFYLDSIAAFIVACVSTCIIAAPLFPSAFPGASIGIAAASLTGVMQLTLLLNWFVRTSAEIESMAAAGKCDLRVYMMVYSRCCCSVLLPV